MDGKYITIGFFSEKELAAKAYQDFAIINLENFTRFS